MRERINNPLLHHKVKDFRTQAEVFEKICAACAELTEPSTAFREIDRVLDTAARTKRPVYIELPRDMVNVVPDVPYPFRSLEPVSEPETLSEAVAEAIEWINRSQRVVIVAGVEIHRFGLQDDVVALAEGSNIAFAATILGKSVISELHPLYVGLYEGAMGHEEVTTFVEESDCVILLGTFMTDLNLGVFTANLNSANCIYATSEQLRIRHHHFQGVLLPDFIRALAAARPRPPARPLPSPPKRRDERFQLQPDAPITIARLMARLNESLTDDTAIIADVGDALFAATELVVRTRTTFISPAYYTSMGFAVPAALGVQVAQPTLRVIAIVGDGAFQMTCNELSTIVRHGFPTIVIVLDNRGYGTERVLHPGNFNDINPWQYHKLPQIFNGGAGYEVRTEGQFDEALRRALADTNGMSLIQAHIGLDDHSSALRRLADRLSKRV
jgi:indolepyruvate decarboxylase